MRENVASARRAAQLYLRGLGCDQFRGSDSYLNVTLSDAAVVRHVLAGDTEAYAILVERYYQRCARYAVHVIGNREDAEEAVQDTLLRAFRSLDRYEERGQFTSWLFRILANQCRSAVARVARREREFPDVYGDDVLPLEVGPNGESETVAIHNSTGDRLDAALAQLPADQREALALRFGESLSYEDMSAITGAGVSALKMRVSRATARLRALLEEVHHV